ncbi:helix-turn-helix domain-containing protein [Thalassolituus marinus]|uniref:Helix-turn-helix domain-containing protein n=1 Tax=Thalassolituus marinus TaxID=671053 RepID=A0ABS7ZYH6_9GAMM|nr:helix-turn-helix domain-containing protein [Thalassolituus marinus]MCA6065420.1 helix-turn-helix domain-containing protein [Thalassolituus marinus]
MALSKLIARKYLILKALTELRRPSIDDIAEHSKLPRPTINRYIRSLREDYGMDIQYIPGETGGHYRIMDWCGLNHEEFMKHCARHYKELQD